MLSVYTSNWNDTTAPSISCTSANNYVLYDCSDTTASHTINISLEDLRRRVRLSEKHRMRRRRIAELREHNALIRWGEVQRDP